MSPCAGFLDYEEYEYNGSIGEIKLTEHFLHIPYDTNILMYLHFLITLFMYYI